MLNVNELTSQMAKMSDAQLRQYAQLHKTDPYTLALAASESKRRAQLRAAGQQQAAQQPTVADQALAQMGAPAPMPQPQLPEQQGIGMLPAQNVQGMADGGIAGYDDQFVDSYADAYAGGGIVAFAGKDGSVVEETSSPFERTTIGGFLAPIGSAVSRFLSGPQYDTNTQQQLQIIDKQFRDLSARRKDLTGAFGFQQQTPAQQAEAAELDRQINALWQQSQALKSGAVKAAPAPTQDRPNTTTPVETYRNITAPNPASQPEIAQVQPQAQTQRARTSTDSRPGVGTTTKDDKAGTTTAPDFVPGKPGDLTTELARLQKMSPGTKAYDDLSAKIKQGYADLERVREEGKPKDKAYAGLEALLAKDEEKAKGKEERNLKMALIGAGLAIAGGKSQYALQNIAEGAQVGTKQYQEGVEKLEAAALERRKQGAMIEEARRAEARGDWKDAQQFKQKAFEADLGVKQAQIAAVQDLYKTDLKTASDIVNNQNTLASADRRSAFEQQQQTLRAREQNVAQLQGQRIMAAAYGARAADRGAITPALVLKEYNDNLAKDTLGDFQKRYPTPQHYMAAIQQMMNPTIVSELPQNANVRK